jgi:putative ABC transport system permease protein
MRIPLVRGRTFSSSDREGSQPVAIISASMAQRFWPGQDPSGRLLRLDESGDEWVTVVGVVGDVKMYNWRDGGNSDAVYMPLGQAPPAFVQVALRTRGEPGRATASVREAVRSIDPLLPVDGVRTMREAIAGSSLGLTHMAVLMGICGAIALVLSAIGIYSVMVYTVAQRTREFGVRIALGATAQDVLRLALRQAGIVTAVGLSTGVVIALLLGQLVASSLFGVVSLDVMLVVWVSVALGAVSMGAAYLPARRALRLDPAAVLRSQ